MNAYKEVMRKRISNQSIGIVKWKDTREEVKERNNVNMNNRKAM